MGGDGGGVVYSLYNRLQRERDARSSPHETAAATASAAALTFQIANCELRTAATAAADADAGAGVVEKYN